MNNGNRKNSEKVNRYRIRIRRSNDNVIIDEQFFRGHKKASEFYQSLNVPGHTKVMEASYVGQVEYVQIVKKAM